MFLLILGRTYKIGRAGGVCTGTPRLLGCIFRLSCRLASPAQLPVWLERLGCPLIWLSSVARLVCSGPPTYMLVLIGYPGRLILLAYPCVWHDSTNLLDRSFRHFVWPAAWYVSAYPMVGSGPMSGWPGRLLCTCPNCCFGPSSHLAASARLPGWLAWLHQPTSSLGPASRLAGSTRQSGRLARLR